MSKPVSSAKLAFEAGRRLGRGYKVWLCNDRVDRLAFREYHVVNTARHAMLSKALRDEGSLLEIAGPKSALP